MDNQNKAALSPVRAMQSEITSYAKPILKDEQKARDFATRVSVMVKDQPRLAQALVESPNSFLTAMIASVTLDLMPNTSQQLAFLIPYKNNHTNKMEVQFQVGYQGVLKLAYNTGLVSHVDAGLVFPEDTQEPYKFVYSIGENETFDLVPNLTIDRTNLDKASAIYAIAYLSNGKKAYKVMTLAEINKVRESAKAKSTDSPWNTWPEQQAKKTALKQLFKYAQRSITNNKLEEAIHLDNLAEAGKLQYADGKFIEGKTIDLHPQEPSRDIHADVIPVAADEVKEEAASIAEKLLEGVTVE